MMNTIAELRNKYDLHMRVEKYISDEAGIPVAKVVKTVNGLDYVIVNNDYYFLSKKINGEHITDIYKDNYKDLSIMIGKEIAGFTLRLRSVKRE